MHKSIAKYVLAVILLFLVCVIVSADSETDSFNNIKSLASGGNTPELSSAVKKFYREYPRSNYVADIRLILADMENIPAEAVTQYRTIVDKYRYFRERDRAQFRICEILNLLSKWSDLRQEAVKGEQNFRDSSLYTDFRFFHAQAAVNLGKFDEAREICLDITGHDHSQENLSRALLLLSHINRKTTGLSRGYLYSLNEIITGFSDASSLPAAIFLIGRFYESMEDYDRAYSAYLDVKTKFPKSPEAAYSETRLSDISDRNPSRTRYLPPMESIENIDKIDIQPEIDIEEKDYTAGKIIYSISLGPFETEKHALEIKNLIKKDFSPLKIVSISGRYILYAGRETDLDSAASIRVRLAEEFGINGNLVKMIKDSERLFIHEE